MLLGVDVGGTFTDAVIAVDGRLVTAKAPSTPRDQSEGVMAAISAALERAGGEPADVEAFAHGMTVATNALLEGAVARTALLATEGFTDVVALGRQARADLYRLCAGRPAPLTPPERRIAVAERMGPDGPLRALEAAGVEAAVEAVAACGAEAVAVVLLHAYAHPEHEQALGRALAERLPGVHASLSHDVVGTFREYERAATTEVDAALSPLVGAYLRALAARAGEAGLPTPDVMQSSGGLATLELAAEHAALTVLSGPAGGAAAAALIAAQTGVRDLLCFDMGGTSCDVCVVDDGAVRETPSYPPREIAGRPLALPMVDIHTVGAGGGSIAWRDPGGALRVGPRSAGADPGPACYGRGGREPTVTDANLLLGRLDPAAELAGGVALDRAAAEAAVAGLARTVGLEPLACAEGIVRVANVEMVRALRVMTVERGVDPRGYALLAFGGAGGLHATAIADELGIDRVLAPRASGVLSALGLAVAARRTDARRSVLLSGDALSDAAIAAVVDDLARELAGERRVTLELRYAGQSFELAVPWEGDVRERFAAAHEERYGYRDPDGEIELVTVQVSAVRPGPRVELRAGAGAREPDGEREVTIDGRPHAAAIWRGELAEGARLSGPAVWQGPEATLLVAPGWSGAVDATGTVILGRD